MGGDELEHLLHAADDHRRHEDAQGHGADDAGLVAGTGRDEEDRVGEQPGHDRGDAGHDVDEEGDGPGDPAAVVLHEEDGGEQSQGHRDEGGDPGDLEGADDAVVEAAVGGVGAAHVRGQEVVAEAGRAAGQDHPHQGDQGHHDDGEGQVDEEGHQGVAAPAIALAHPGDGRGAHHPDQGGQGDDGGDAPSGQQADPADDDERGSQRRPDEPVGQAVGGQGHALDGGRVGQRVDGGGRGLGGRERGLEGLGRGGAVGGVSSGPGAGGPTVGSGVGSRVGRVRGRHVSWLLRTRSGAR